MCSPCAPPIKQSVTDKDFYLEFHGFTPGTPEAEKAWEQKEAMNAGERFLPCPTVFVGMDVRYDSPIDGRAITNKQARVEDLKRAGCVEYDPGMKQDYQRRIETQQQALEASVEKSVEREIETMPGRKREKLAAEIQGGLTPEIVRT